VAVKTRRDQICDSIGTYGWDGGLGSAYRSDPREGLLTILLTQRGWSSPQPPAISLDFWTSVYQAIED
jgi:CubicO group peptidase (beta-lactamase class C family)